MRLLKSISFGSLILLAVLLTGCGEGGDTPETETAAVRGVTDSTITVGTWAPLTGPAALWGAVGRGIEMYFEIINAEGGVGGRKIRVVLKDDGYNPSRTVSAVREMIDRDEVFAFVGGVGTAGGQAVMGQIQDAGIPWIGPVSGSTQWAFPPKDLVFSTYPPYIEEAAVLTDYAVNELGQTKLGVLYINDEYGKSGLVGVQMVMEQRGLELVDAVSHELMDTDLTSQVLRLKEAGAETVLLWTTPKAAATAVGTAAKLDFQPQWMASSTLSDMPLMYRITEGLWEGTIYVNLGLEVNSDDPKMVALRQAQERYLPEEEPGVFLFAGVTLGAEPFVEALRRVEGPLTTESFVAAMESLDGFQGTGPAITFGPDRRQGARSVFLSRCLENAASEQLTDWSEPLIDLEAAIARLEAGV